MPELDVLEGLARLGCTHEELADLVGCARSTITEKLGREPYKTAWRRGSAEMKLSVRRGLMRLVDSGQPAGTIFAAKVILGMAEPPRETHNELHVDGTVTTRWLACWGEPTVDAPVNRGQIVSADVVEDGDWGDEWPANLIPLALGPQTAV